MSPKKKDEAPYLKKAKPCPMPKPEDNPYMRCPENVKQCGVLAIAQHASQGQSGWYMHGLWPQVDGNGIGDYHYFTGQGSDRRGNSLCLTPTANEGWRSWAGNSVSTHVFRDTLLEYLRERQTAIQKSLQFFKDDVQDAVHTRSGKGNSAFAEQ